MKSSRIPWLGRLVPQLRITLLCLLIFTHQTHALLPAQIEARLANENPEFKALSQRIGIFREQVEKSSQITTPQLYAEFSLLRDRKEQSNSQFVFEELQGLNYEVGLEKQFESGLRSKLSFSGLNSNIKNGSFGAGVFNSNSWNNSPKLELAYPLLSGAGGTKIVAAKQSTELALNLEALRTQSEFDQKLHGVKMLYWSALLAKETVRVQKEAIQRVRTIFEYVRSQAARNLEQASNVIQARAVAELVLLETTANEDRFKKSLLSLQEVFPGLQEAEIPMAAVAEAELQKKPSENGLFTANDLLALTAQELDLVKAKADQEDTRSNLDIFAAHEFNEVEDSFGKSIGELSKMKYPTTVVGLRWKYPLDVGFREREAKRQIALAGAAKDRFQYVLDQAPLKKANILAELGRAKRLFLLTENLEKTQLERLQAEKKLLRQGRSSIYQVLQFEIEFTRSQVSRISSMLEILRLQSEVSQLKFSEADLNQKLSKGLVNP